MSGAFCWLFWFMSGAFWRFISGAFCRPLWFMSGVLLRLFIPGAFCWPLWFMFGAPCWRFIAWPPCGPPFLGPSARAKLAKRTIESVKTIEIIFFMGYSSFLVSGFKCAVHSWMWEKVPLQFRLFSFSAVLYGTSFRKNGVRKNIFLIFFMLSRIVKTNEKEIAYCLTIV